MGWDYPIKNLMPLQKPRLLMADDVVEYGFQFPYHNWRENFIDHIVESDGSEVTQTSFLLGFRYKCDESSVKARAYLFKMSQFFDKIPDILCK